MSFPTVAETVEKDVAGELHTVAGVSGEADYHLLQFFDFYLSVVLAITFT